MINSQRKGIRGEAEVVDILRAHGFDARRNGCYEAKDITLIIDGEPLDIEVKRGQVSCNELYELLKVNDEVWHRRNGQIWMVTRLARNDLALRLLAKGELRPEPADVKAIREAIKQAGGWSQWKP